MSANQSDLSNAAYGYDLVVATTQNSINGALKQYLYDITFPSIQMYWNQDSQGSPVPVTRAELLTQTNGTDPLLVPGWTEGQPMTPDIQNISNSNFYFAFEAAVGIPADLAPWNIPDIIALQPDSQSVVFNLLCAQFTVVTCNFGRRGLTSYLNVSQPADTPWTFTSIVPLKQIFDDTNLPASVQSQLDDLGPDAFSVQQLFFDLDNASLESAPAISGVDPGSPAYTALQQVFLGAYFAAMKVSGQPILNYSIVQTVSPDDPGTLTLTQLELEVSPYTPAGPATNGLNTLNYLCATNGDGLPPPVPFTWNWVESSETSSFDGVVSINRDTFARYFQGQLTDLVSQNCYLPSVRVTLCGPLDTEIDYSWEMAPGQTPALTTPSTGADVLSYSYSGFATDDAGADGDMGSMNLAPSYSATVAFSGTTIVITQRLLINVYVRFLQTSATWNAVDRTIADTYTLAVTQAGQLTSSLNTVVTDQSDPTPSTNWFIEIFTQLDDLTNDVAGWVQGLAATSFQSLPVNVAQAFVFPGGNTFAFKDVVFSGNQDLVSHISYVQSN
ncbi:MAG TPA: hypothetical protein VF432_21795 [Thermoanaerobaculia bacterium]